MLSVPLKIKNIKGPSTRASSKRLVYEPLQNDLGKLSNPTILDLFIKKKVFLINSK